ncbi:MAG: T9SS type A sorting domain-containing protein [Chloroflexota bacterium]
MKTILRMQSLALLLLVAAMPTLEGADVSGIINKYAKVVEITRCGVRLAPGSPSFYPGDVVLIIQMKGGQIDFSNTASFGAVTSLSCAGNHELATIKYILNDEVGFNHSLLYSYNPNEGCVQIVSVPSYPSATVTGDLHAQPWNGSTGGVIALQSTGDLVLNADISANGAGFAGGSGDNGYIGDNCTDPNWYSQTGTGNNAMKGEGICVVPSTYGAGRGAPANGGGGGNMHNAGGGGGGLAGAGGKGGNEWLTCGATPLGGIGGRKMVFNPGNPRVYLGGGGGKGQQNQGGGTDGKNGGGIIYIAANRILGAGREISADGDDVTLEAWDDGAGGGGAGGTVLINCIDFPSPVNISARGGKGGNTAQAGTCVGPGGGGGGGVVWFKGASAPSNVACNVTGGNPGILTLGVPGDCENTPYGAEAGENGSVLLGLSVRESDLSPNTITFSEPEIDFGVIVCSEYIDKSIVIYNSSDFSANISKIETQYQGHFSAFPGSAVISGHGSQNINIRFTGKATGPLRDTIFLYSDDLCVSPLKIPVKGDYKPIIYSTSAEIDFGVLCEDSALVAEAVLTNHSLFNSLFSANIVAGKYFELPGNDLSTPVASNESRKIKVRYKGGAGPGVHTETLVFADSCGAEKRITVKVAVSGLKINKKKDVSVCKGSGQFQLSGDYFDVSGGVGKLEYKWSPGNELSDANAEYPTILNPRNMTFTLEVSDSLGCRASMLLTVVVKDGPQLTFEPASLDFGDIYFCKDSKELELKIINIGTTAANVLPGISGADFTIVNPGEKNIQQGDTLSLIVRFDRLLGASGEILGVLKLTDRDCGEYSIALRARLADAEFSYTDSLDLGKIEACEDSAYVWAYINNESKTDELKLGKAFFDRPGPFSTVLETGMGTIVPTEWRFGFAILLTRGAAGIYESVLNIPFEYGDCKDTIRIYVRGEIIPGVEADWTKSLEFEMIPGCDSFAVKRIMIKNIGSSRIDSIRPFNPPIFEFERKAEFDSGLETGDSVEFDVKLIPPDFGVIVGIIRISLFANGCERVIEIPFTGGKGRFEIVCDREIDFGTIADCQERPFLNKLDLMINSFVPCTIKSISTGGDMKLGENFFIDLAPGQDIPLGVNNEYGCEFRPLKAGDFSGYVEITLSVCDSVIRIPVRGSLKQFEVSAPDRSLDFGSLEVNEAGNLIARFINTGEMDAQIRSVYIPQAPFSIINVEPAPPCAIGPGDTLSVTCGFVSAVAGSFADSVKLISEPCALELTTKLLARVSHINGDIVVEAGRDSAAPGEKAIIPLKLFAGSSASNELYRYRATLKFNKTLLCPEFASVKDSTCPESRRCVIQGETRLVDTTLKELIFTAALGDREFTPIEIEEFEFVNAGDIPVETRDGLFTLLGICREGGARLVNPGSRLEAPIVKPNPAYGDVEITFRPVERGMTTLNIYDAFGRLHKTLYQGNPELKNTIIRTTVDDLPQGVYLVEFQTPTRRLAVKLVVAD